MNKIVSINPVITKALKNIDINQGRLYLLAKYFNINANCISEEVRVAVTNLGIEDNGTWKIPLFTEEKQEAFHWISEWMEGFGRINPNRKGTKSAVMARMKKFFSQHPEVRVDDVFKARDAYLRTVSNPTYLKSSHKFIYEGQGFNLSSMLEQYVELIKTIGSSDGRTSKMR
jgi:hypothetical protein